MAERWNAYGESHYGLGGDPVGGFAGERLAERMREEMETVERDSAMISERDDWLQNRKSGIGASDVAAILNMNPWRSPIAVWAEKCGIIEPDDLSENEAVEFGNRLEQPIAEAYAERSGRTVEMWPRYRIMQHHEHQWLRCTPDATQRDDELGEGLVQIKTTSAYKALEWKDEPPLIYQVQVQAEMAVTGYEYATLVCLIGGQRLKYFDCPRDDRFIKAMIPALKRFWDHVQSKTEPPIDASAISAEVLVRLHPNDNGESVALPEDAAEWCSAIERCKSAIKQAEEAKREAENQLKAAIGDATYGVLPDGTRWSWKTQARKGYVVEDSTMRVLRKVGKV